jgi:hypothetical protein
MERELEESAPAKSNQLHLSITGNKKNPLITNKGSPFLGSQKVLRVPKDDGELLPTDRLPPMGIMGFNNSKEISI